MNTEIQEIKLRIAEVKPILTTLEWDISKDQLNPGKKGYYDLLKKEHEELLVKLKQLQNDTN